MEVVVLSDGIAEEVWCGVRRRCVCMGCAFCCLYGPRERKAVRCFSLYKDNPSSRSSRAKAPLAAVPKLKPDEPCTCGSGKKYKKCCM